MINIKTALIALGALSLAACSTSTTDVSRASPPTADMTQYQALVHSAGITDLPNVVQAKTDAELGLARDASMALAGLAGYGSFGFGLIGFLGSPPAGPGAYDALIASVPSSMSGPQLETKLQQIALAPARASLKAAGYKEVPSPQRPHQVVFIKDGCTKSRQGHYKPECSALLEFLAEPKGMANGKRTYTIVGGAGNGPLKPYSVHPSVVPMKQSAAFADKTGGLLSIYVAPRKLEGAWTVPMLYSNGKPRAL